MPLPHRRGHSPALAASRLARASPELRSSVARAVGRAGATAGAFSPRGTRVDVGRTGTTCGAAALRSAWTASGDACHRYTSSHGARVIVAPASSSSAPAQMTTVLRRTELLPRGPPLFAAAQGNAAADNAGARCQHQQAKSDWHPTATRRRGLSRRRRGWRGCPGGIAAAGVAGGLGVTAAAVGSRVTGAAGSATVAVGAAAVGLRQEQVSPSAPRWEARSV